MDNQHRKIAGYRELSQADIDLMNRIKAHEAAGLALLRAVQDRLADQTMNAVNGSQTEMDRLANAEPGRWASIAKTELQQGYMALVRAVAQPATP